MVTMRRAHRRAEDDTGFSRRDALAAVRTPRGARARHRWFVGFYRASGR